MIDNDLVNYRKAECCANCIYHEVDPELDEQIICLLFSEDRTYSTWICDKFIKGE